MGFYQRMFGRLLDVVEETIFPWTDIEISIQSYLLFLFKNNKAITILRRDEKGYGKRILILI
jgi:hypothetical protein